MMSLWLFNIFMNGVVRDQGCEVRSEVDHILFADHPCLTVYRTGKLRNLVSEYGKMCEKMKLKVNEAKMKMLSSSRGDGLENETLEKGAEHPYLG